MKRSEMLRLMRDTVFDAEYTNDLSMHFAELLLAAQEKAGMLPPKLPLPKELKSEIAIRFFLEHVPNKWEEE